MRGAVILASTLVVAAGSRLVFEFSNTMMSHVALVGAWLMLMLGVAYAGVRIDPRVGGAMLAGFGIGTMLVLLFAGMQIMS
ncbi:hypothetical protein [Amycolatopsis sp. cmx-4-61]|uniref:hypothetical protein n=1 Tax=Amycolatopsis sp. cmx-4-61 TaxID=2790937 RepID=UPI0039799D11